jgi:hypothetical protein
VQEVIVPSLPVETLSSLVVIELGVTVLCLAATLVLAAMLVRTRNRYRRLLAGGPDPEDVIAAFDRHLAAVERLRGTVDSMGREIASIRQQVSGHLRTAGLTRYDAFDDVGGQLSYSAAFVDEAGDGVVLTGINSRTETRSYAKPIEGGTSIHNLSEEERQAIALAQGRSLAARSGAPSA